MLLGWVADLSGPVLRDVATATVLHPEPGIVVSGRDWPVHSDREAVDTTGQMKHWVSPLAVVVGMPTVAAIEHLVQSIVAATRSLHQ